MRLSTHAVEFSSRWNIKRFSQNNKIV